MLDEVPADARRVILSAILMPGILFLWLTAPTQLTARAVFACSICAVTTTCAWLIARLRGEDEPLANLVQTFAICLSVATLVVLSVLTVQDSDPAAVTRVYRFLVALQQAWMAAGWAAVAWVYSGCGWLARTTARAAMAASVVGTALFAVAYIFHFNPLVDTVIWSARSWAHVMLDVVMIGYIVHQLRKWQRRHHDGGNGMAQAGVEGCH